MDDSLKDVFVLKFCHFGGQFRVIPVVPAEGGTVGRNGEEGGNGNQGI